MNQYYVGIKQAKSSTKRQNERLLVQINIDGEIPMKS